jgi:hypothetical protein
MFTSLTLLSEWKSPLGKFSSLASSLISAARSHEGDVGHKATAGEVT